MVGDPVIDPHNSAAVVARASSLRPRSRPCLRERATLGRSFPLFLATPSSCPVVALVAFGMLTSPPSQARVLVSVLLGELPPPPPGGSHCATESLVGLDRRRCHRHCRLPRCARGWSSVGGCAVRDPDDGSWPTLRSIIQGVAFGVVTGRSR